MAMFFMPNRREIADKLRRDAVDAGADDIVD
jgi:hypothetical protein